MFLFLVTELDDEVRLKVNNKKNKRKSANDCDFAGSFQGKKMYLVSSAPKHCMWKLLFIIILGN